MKCVVINGTQIKGCTYHLKELFLAELKPAQLTEFYFPKDAPPYCTGCKRCFLESETLCPHFKVVQPIWEAMLEADLIVFAYPVYVLRAPGQIKSLLDHFGVHWFAHRPEPRLFGKSAAIITQSIGAPNGSAQKDVKTSLEWLGISDIHTIGFGMMEGVIWDEISAKRRQKFADRTRRFARRCRHARPDKRSLKFRFYFFLGRSLQKSVLKKLPPGEQPQPDLQHWLDQGWVTDERGK